MEPLVSAELAKPDAAGDCPRCHRQWGAGITCQFCDQLSDAPLGVEISSVGRRFGAFLLDGLLQLVTLYVGWLIWALIVFGQGQTPAKQLLGMRVLKLRTGKAATWGTMFFREVIAKSIVGILSFLTLGIINFWLVWDRQNQELWDKVAGTLVLNDPHRQLD